MNMPKITALPAQTNLKRFHGGMPDRNDTGLGLRLRANQPHSIQLKDVTDQAGIEFVHTDGSSGRRYIVETVASGLATFDFDGDGLIDILFLNGAPLPGAKAPSSPRNALYRNEGHWKFKDVTTKAGLNDRGYHLGVCVGDYDNDGDPDIFLNNFGPNILYRNNGDSTFTDVTLEAGLKSGDEVGAGACFLDADGDGDLDLFVAQYVAFSFEKHHIFSHEWFSGLCRPPELSPHRECVLSKQWQRNIYRCQPGVGDKRFERCGHGSDCL
jgi:hypothetical protein